MVTAESGLYQLNSDGTQDPSFQTPWNLGNIQDAVAIEAGKILVGSGNINRLNADGTVDSTFHSPDDIRTVYAILPLHDGRSLITAGIVDPEHPGTETMTTVALLPSH